MTTFYSKGEIMKLTNYSEFADMPTPEPPPLVPAWRKIYREGPAPRVKDENRVSDYSAKCNFHKTLDEIAEELGISQATVVRTINSAMKKLEKNLEELTGISDRMELMQSMLHSKEEPGSFMNPNAKGGLAWHIRRSSQGL